jgi:hypothetical protein
LIRSSRRVDEVAHAASIKEDSVRGDLPFEGRGHKFESGAPDFNDLVDGILHDRLSRKRHGSSDQEVIRRFVAFLSGRAF